MARLNGFQRLWIFISGLWMLLFVWLGWLQVVRDTPQIYGASYNHSPDSSVLQAMDKSDWDQSGCPSDWSEAKASAEAFLRKKENAESTVMALQAEEPDSNEFQLLRFPEQPANDAWLCVGRKVSEAETDRIRHDYARAYTKLTRSKQFEDVRVFAALALFPPAVLYGFGAAVAWVIRGFRKQEKS
jgi:hypothetical protein